MTPIEIKNKLYSLESKFKCHACHTVWYNTVSDFPTVGKSDRQYMDRETGALYIWDGDSYITSSGGGGVTNVLFYTNFASFPVTGTLERLYVDETTGAIYIWNGATYIIYETPDEIAYATNFAAFPVTGEVDKLYVDKATSRIYTWTGATYQTYNAQPVITHQTATLGGVVTFTNPNVAYNVLSLNLVAGTYIIQAQAYFHNSTSGSVLSAAFITDGTNEIVSGQQTSSNTGSRNATIPLFQIYTCVSPVTVTLQMGSANAGGSAVHTYTFEAITRDNATLLQAIKIA